MERDAEIAERGLQFPQPAEHEAVLPRARVGELGDEREDHVEWSAVLARDGEGVAERPVVHRPLVPGHPVDHRAVAHWDVAAPQRADPPKVAPHSGRYASRRAGESVVGRCRRRRRRGGRCDASDAGPHRRSHRRRGTSERCPSGAQLCARRGRGSDRREMRREDRHGARELGNAAAGRFGYRSTAHEVGASGELTHAAASFFGSADNLSDQ